MVNGKNKMFIKETMFASNYEPEVREQLKNCLRVMPHHQDTSGFFITIIEKVKEFDDVKQTNPTETEEDRKAPLPLQIQQSKSINFIRCDPQDPDFQYLKSYYGLSDEFNPHQLIA